MPARLLRLHAEGVADLAGWLRHDARVAHRLLLQVAAALTAEDADLPAPLHFRHEFGGLRAWRLPEGCFVFDLVDGRLDGGFAYAPWHRRDEPFEAWHARMQAFEPERNAWVEARPDAVAAVAACAVRRAAELSGALDGMAATLRLRPAERRAASSSGLEALGLCLSPAPTEAGLRLRLAPARG